MNKYYTAGIIIITAFALIIGGTGIMQQPQRAGAFVDNNVEDFTDRKVPITISEDNVYVVWTTDKNMPNNNSEVMFRAST
ncbi:MAG: hypothetical protein ACRD8W_30605, partial [Nitrososphaeraceae archaeon]